LEGVLVAFDNSPLQTCRATQLPGDGDIALAR
jgi:hypothetical protein